mmetsp:Transcript_30327/g.46416  ORF Transcript_30327/g.46416 Transcript_30327/m.46416 type:complete len:496 (-) Transcript_30327:1178-2665(-)
MLRPSSIPPTIVEKLSSTITKSDASFATSVPVIPIATPISACCRAGASLTPSPVIAVISLWLCNILMSFCLSEGSARQKTMLSVFRISSCSCSGLLKNSRPSNAFKGLPSSWKIFTSFAMAIAVSFASPVIIINRIPASVHFKTLSATSGLAGSLIPTIPTRVKPLSMSANFEWSESKGCFLAASPLPSDSSGACNFREIGRCSVSFTANAKHLKGLVANSDVFAMITRRKSPVNFSTVPSLYLMCVHRLIRRLGAPFTRRRLPLPLQSPLPSSLPSPLLPDLQRTPILFLSRLNSRVAVLSKLDRHSLTLTDAKKLGGLVCGSRSGLDIPPPPNFSARMHNAASVGSPIRSKSFSPSCTSCPTILASLHSADTAATSAMDPRGYLRISSPALIPTTLPMGEYEYPTISCSTTACGSWSFSKITKDTAVISLVVNVPVLSVHITLVQPNVSTLGNRLTMTFRFAILLVPSERHNVITAGSPSGIAATPRATATLA